MAFKFRLYPNNKQRIKMIEVVDECRRLWNDALAQRKRRWEEERKSTSYSDQCRILAAGMKSGLGLRNVYSQSAQDVLRRLAKAFDAFFNGSGDYPKFKPYRRCGSFTYPQAYNGSVHLDPSRKRILLSKIGSVRIVAHRSVPSGAKLKTCIVKCETDRRWYACLTYDSEDSSGVMRLPELMASPIGVDLGLKSLITTSDGWKVAPPKFLRKAEEKLNRLQRKLSSKQTGSSNWTKCRLKVTALHAKVRVPPQYSTQECFFCGALNQVPLNVRELACRGCGRQLDRDKNAARIVLKRGILQVGQDKVPGEPRSDGENPNQVVPELKPVETEPLPPQATGVASSVEETGTILGWQHSQQCGQSMEAFGLWSEVGCHPSLIDSNSETADQRVTLAKDGMLGS